MSITLQQMKYFRALARNREWSLTRTAKALYISQPALSYAIASLERELGVELFERRGQRLVLTRNGETFLSSVDNVFARLTDAVEEVRSQQKTGPRRFTVGCVPGLTEGFLHGFLRTCLQRQTDMGDVTLCYRNESELMELLNNGTVDLALCTLPRNGMEYKLLFVAELYLCVPLGHPLAELSRVDPEQLNGLKLVRLSPGDSIQAAADEYLAEHAVHCQIGAIQERLEDAVAWVAGGFGVGIYPLPAVPYCRGKGVRYLPLSGRAPARSVFLARKRSASSEAALERLWEFMLRCGEKWPWNGAADSPSPKSPCISLKRTSA